MQWFAEAFGFPESRVFGEVREAFTLAATAPDSSCPPGAGNAFTLQANVGRFSGRKYHVGPFEPASVEALRTRVREQQRRGKPPRGLSFRNVAGDSYTMHLDKANAGAVFQVASQFNCLEMVGPDVRPEDGVTGYATDRTQGPACAMACPAATVYRNYFYNGRGQGGGSAMQLDTSRHVGDVVGNERQRYWVMSNGYLLPAPGGGHGLAQLSNRLRAEPGLHDKARGAAQASAHWPLPPSASSGAPPLSRIPRARRWACSGTQKWRRPAARRLRTGARRSSAPRSPSPTRTASAKPSGSRSPACSSRRRMSRPYWCPPPPSRRHAIPRAHARARWRRRTRASQVGASLALHRGTRVTVYLTSLGGGAFGNPPEWIVKAMSRALDQCANMPVDVRLVHYGHYAGGDRFGMLERDARYL